MGLKTGNISPWWPAKLILSIAIIAYAIYAMWSGPLSPGLKAPLWAGQGLIIAGAVTHLWHFFLLKRQAGPLGAPQTLVSSGGLFPWVRHPMYFGDSIMIAGAASMAGDIVALAMAAFFWGIVFQVARDEDRMMATQFPCEFPRWAARSKLILPGLL